ncbi:MAG: NUDIX domain-containing protein [Sphingomonas sp.]
MPDQVRHDEVNNVTALLHFLHRCRHLALRILRVKTRGVKVMAFNPAGELLLIRNTYGHSHLFMLPGGGIERRESPSEAAARELEEETGIRAERVEARSTYSSRAEGMRDTIYLFTALAAHTPKPCGIEVQEARFFPLDSLPENVSNATLCRIAEYRGERAISETW